jgi:hypothetical protein
VGIEGSSCFRLNGMDGMGSDKLSVLWLAFPLMESCPFFCVFSPIIKKYMHAKEQNLDKQLPLESPSRRIVLTIRPRLDLSTIYLRVVLVVECCYKVSLASPSLSMGGTSVRFVVHLFYRLGEIWGKFPSIPNHGVNFRCRFPPGPTQPVTAQASMVTPLLQQQEVG